MHRAGSDLHEPHAEDLNSSATVPAAALQVAAQLEEQDVARLAAHAEALAAYTAAYEAARYSHMDDDEQLAIRRQVGQHRLTWLGVGRVSTVASFSNKQRVRAR